MIEPAEIVWQEGDTERRAHWRSEADFAAPKRVVLADDTMSADKAYRLACEGTALLWRGDFHNARQLMQALTRRIEHSKPASQPCKTPAEAFHAHRMRQGQIARTAGRVLIPFAADHTIPLRRAPDVRSACTEAYGVVSAAYVASLRELLGVVGAYEWRRKGVDVPALGPDVRIHAHYGVFSPMRSEYLDLVAQAPVPQTELAFDIGTGTGVLAALLAKRGLKRIIATDCDPRALACARDNLHRLGLAAQVEVIAADLFPSEDNAPAGLIVCNPPWLPGKPSSPLEHAIYDPESRMLKGFLDGLGRHLAPGGEGWLILSDFAEHLGLRTRIELLHWIEAAGLKTLGRIDARPHHRKMLDATDPLHAARQAEVISLWRLGAN